MSHVKDPTLAAQGRLNLEIAEKHMSALLEVQKRFAKEQPFKGLTIGMALHVTKETGILVRTLVAGGAKVEVHPLLAKGQQWAAVTATFLYVSMGWIFFVLPLNMIFR